MGKAIINARFENVSTEHGFRADLILQKDSAEKIHAAGAPTDLIQRNGSGEEFITVWSMTLPEIVGKELQPLPLSAAAGRCGLASVALFTGSNGQPCAALNTAQIL